jgi:hypothetical protein
VVDCWINLLQTKQRDDENVVDYTQRFMSCLQMNGALAGGPYCADSLVIDHRDFDQSDNVKVGCRRADVVERLLTMLYIKSTSESRFGSTGSFVEELQSQQSLKNVQYPRTDLAAQEILQGRKWDKSDYKQQQKYKQEVNTEARDDVSKQRTTGEEIPE